MWDGGLCRAVCQVPQIGALGASDVGGVRRADADVPAFGVRARPSRPAQRALRELVRVHAEQRRHVGHHGSTAAAAAAGRRVARLRVQPGGARVVLGARAVAAVGGARDGGPRAPRHHADGVHESGARVLVRGPAQAALGRLVDRQSAEDGGQTQRRVERLAERVCGRVRVRARRPVVRAVVHAVFALVAWPRVPLGARMLRPLTPEAGAQLAAPRQPLRRREEELVVAHARVGGTEREQRMCRRVVRVLAREQQRRVAARVALVDRRAAAQRGGDEEAHDARVARHRGVHQRRVAVDVSGAQVGAVVPQ